MAWFWLLIHVEDCLYDASLRLEPVREFANEVIVTGLMREPRVGVDDAVLDQRNDSCEIAGHGIATGFDGQLRPVNGHVFEGQLLRSDANVQHLPGEGTVLESVRHRDVAAGGIDHCNR